VYHRSGPDVPTGPVAGRDQANLGQDKMQQQQQQPGGSQAPHGSDGSSSSSGSCDTVLVVEQDASRGKHQHARTEKVSGFA
jgi:hypothetical protein